MARYGFGECLLEQEINGLLRDLGHALIDAVADSSEVTENLRRIQQAGYCLYLSVDCKHDSHAQKNQKRVALKAPRLPATEPVFKINTEDLSFLRSIGIDPTRKSRRRR